MTTYKQDLNLPSHGKRAKADNAGTVRVKITRRCGSFITIGPDGFDLFLNIDLATKTFHASVEVDAEKLPKRKTIDIEIPTGVIEQIVELSQNKEFMSLKNDDIFPDMMMMDGNEVQIKIKSDIGSVSLDSNMLDDTLLNGFIPTSKGDFDTPIHELAAIARDKLSINLEEGEGEEE